MKKLVSVLSVLLILVGILPFYTFAAESSRDRDLLVSQACEAFPEYAATIRGENNCGIATQSSDETVVYSAEKNISENQTIGITVFNTGGVVIVSGSSYANVIDNGSTSSDVGPDKIGSAHFKVTHNTGSGIVYINSIGFILHQNGTGYFTNYGSCSAVNGASAERDAKTTTYLSYGLTFWPNTTYNTVDFRVSIGNGHVRGYINV